MVSLVVAVASPDDSHTTNTILICRIPNVELAFNHLAHFYVSSRMVVVMVSAMWHLVLLIPARDKKSEFVRWHGRQALILAGVRTVIPLVSMIVLDELSGELLSILILIPIWIFGTLWGQRQATHGDCSLARWYGRTDVLPGPSPEMEPEHIVEQSDEALEDIVCISRDPDQRQVALDRLGKRSLVEYL